MIGFHTDDLVNCLLKISFVKFLFRVSLFGYSNDKFLVFGFQIAFSEGEFLLSDFGFIKFIEIKRQRKQHSKCCNDTRRRYLEDYFHRPLFLQTEVSIISFLITLKSTGLSSRHSAAMSTI